MEQETILIVDDNKEIVAALSDVLKSRGYRTIYAYNGRDGLRMALQDRPDLVMLDWNLPQLTGYQVLQALRERGNKAPVVLMTIYGSENVAVQAFRLGIRDYIPKPFRVPETLEAIERALAEDRLRREKERISEQLAQANRQMEQQLLELTTLQAIGQSVTSVLELEKVLDRVVEAACYFSDARESSLLLLDDKEDTLVLNAHHGVDRSRPINLRIRYSTSPLRKAIETGQPLFLTAGSSDFSIKLKTDYLVRSLLYVPLYIQDRPLGVLGVTDKIGGQMFTKDDARLLTSLASYVAIAIENARLYESEKELARIETVKQMIVTLSHYIMNPLTAINLSTYELSTRNEQGELSDTEALRRNLQLIEMNIKEITAVISILQRLASPRTTTYVGDIQMIDIEDQVRDRVQQIRGEYPELDNLLTAVD
ncbi:MAG: response regulator [Anaerolineae bacterium]|nr:response regulator [Anaerolineae bacterium]